MRMGVITSRVERDYFMRTAEEVSKHIKAVGEAIVADADDIRLLPDNIYSITITAEIAPCTNITYVRYEIERRADPRIPERGNKDS